MEYNDKKEKARNFVAEHLKEDIIDPRNLPLRETSLNWAISILRLAVTAVNVVYSTVQIIFSAMLALGDLIAKGLNKAMPAPKVTETSKAVRILDESWGKGFALAQQPKDGEDTK